MFFGLFKPIENKRIEFLFKLYKQLIINGLTSESATIHIWGEIRQRAGQLKNRFGFKDKNDEQRKSLITDVLQIDTSKYNIYRTIVHNQLGIS